MAWMRSSFHTSGLVSGADVDVDGEEEELSLRSDVEVVVEPLCVEADGEGEELPLRSDVEGDVEGGH
jgi:hypothetical protein